MSPLSLPVLGAAVLVSFPALWNALVAGTTPTFVGLSRFLVALLVSWAAFGVLAFLVGPAPKEEADEADETEPDAAPEPVASHG